MGYAAILFDLDGTLLDTLEDLADAMNEVLARRGLPAHPVAAYRYFVGEGVEELVRRALPESQRAADTVAGCLVDLRAVYGECWDRKTRPYPGVPELLDALTARGLPLCILSNKVHEMTEVIVSRLLSRWRWQIVLGARPGVPKKPDPTVPLAIARQLARSPGEFLFLGDTGIDMQAARAAGMFAVGARWGFRTVEELEANGAQALLTQPLELLPLLDG